MSSKSWKIIFTNLVRVYAKELRAQGITVNTVIPGYTKTDAWNPVLATDEIRVATENRMKETTSGGWIEPGEIGEVVSFLFSNTAQSITGQALNVDRGLHLQ